MPDRAGRGASAPGLLGSLRFQVLAFLTLALLPIGLLGVLQTRNLTREMQGRYELNLLALTERAYSGEQRVISRAFGAAEALSAVIQQISENPDDCERYLANYATMTRQYAFVGFLPPDGVMTCASARGVFDLSGSPRLAETMENPMPRVVRVDDPITSDSTAITVLQPAFRDDVLIGYVVLSIPETVLATQTDDFADRRPLSLVTFNAKGEFLTAESSLDDALDSLPRDIPLADLVGLEAATFLAESHAGEMRIYAVDAVIPDVVNAVASWAPEDESPGSQSYGMLSVLFPVLMWLASLVVAYVAVNRLVLRHVRRLSRKMRRFAVDRRLPPDAELPPMSRELAELDGAFTSMALALMADEAQMEDALREKNVLLREVYHRVKNNLQMISSIMNLQMRKAANPETRAALKRLQDRVLGLASVHRNLYQSADLSKTDAGALLREIFDQTLLAAIPPGIDPRVETRFDSVHLFPDQAVPLALLASELATNALKYLGAPKGGRPWLSATFVTLGPQRASLTVGNSVAPDCPETATEDGAGLGSQLVRAFAMQMGAEIVIDRPEGGYVVTATFDVHDVAPKAMEY